MKIAIIGPASPLRGGVAQYNTLLIRELSRHHEVLPVSFKRQYPGFFYPGRSNYAPEAPAFSDTPAEFIIDSLNPWTWERAVCRIKSFEPDMVLFHWWVSFWAPLFYVMVRRLKGDPRAPEIVFLCHNVLEHEPHPVKKQLAKYVFKTADRFITHCREESLKLKTLIPPGAPVITGFHPTYRDVCTGIISKTEAKKELGVMGDVLLFFGFVRKYKGLHILLEAMAHVLKEKSVTLLVVGEFWEDTSSYLAMIDRLRLKDHVRLVNEYVPRERMGMYFSAADLVVQPYLQASGSGVAQLAFGFDRPVVATWVGSLGEIIENGVNGRLVSPNDPAALADALLESLAPDVLAAMTHQCKATKEKYSWSELAGIITNGGRAVGG